MKKAMLRMVVLIVVVLAAGAGAYFGYMSFIKGEESANSDLSQSQLADDINDSVITITASGDMLAHDSVNMSAKTESGYDYKPFFSNVSGLFNGDINFCNQEGVSAGEDYGITGYPSFNAPKIYSSDLNEVGCNLINLANNHIGDKGIDGILETLKNWKGLNTLAVTGAYESQEDKDNIRYFEVEGVKFAFLAYTDLSNNSELPRYSLSMFDDALTASQVKEASDNSDFVIVSAHWGIEDSNEVSQTQRKYAQILAENGADLVIGTGPHVLQEAEYIEARGNKALVLYSLGNMLSTQLEIEQLIGGVARIEVDTNSKEIINVSFRPTYMHYEWTEQEAKNEDLLARKNLGLYKLSQAESVLSKSLFKTTVTEQMDYVKKIFDEEVVTVTN